MWTVFVAAFRAGAEGSGSRGQSGGSGGQGTLDLLFHKLKKLITSYLFLIELKGKLKSYLV